MTYLSYWTFLWAWVDRAASDAASFFGWNVKTAITTPTLLILGFVLLWKIKGTTAARDEVVKFVIVTLAPLVCFLAFLIMYNFLRAPYLIYAEEQKVLETELGTWRARAGNAEAKNAKDATTILQLGEKLSQAEKSLKIPSAAPAASTEDATRIQRRQNRETIAMLMERGTAIEQACLTKEEKPELGVQAGDWAKQAYSLLKGMDPSFAARFNGASGPTYGHGVPQVNENVWNFLNLRMQVLSSLASELRD